MASLLGSIIPFETATSAVMKIPGILSDLDELEELLQDRNHQTNPDTLEFSAAVMLDLLALFGVSKKQFGPMLGVSDEKAVRGWFTGQAVPRQGALRMARLLTESMVEAPARPDAEGAASCMEAIEPHMQFLLERAAAAGWSEADVLSSVHAWVSRRAG